MHTIRFLSFVEGARASSDFAESNDNYNIEANMHMSNKANNQIK